MAWSPADANGICTLSVGVSAYDDTNLQSTISGPVTVKQIPNASNLSAPPNPTQTVEQIVFTNPADAYGNSSYLYTADCLPNNSYHVYRALDTTLLAVDSEFRNTNGFRTLTGVTYDGTLYNPDGSPINPSPLQAIDFQVASAPLAEPSELTVTNWNAIANLFGNEAAFQRITGEAVSTSGNSLSYSDQGLPSGSDSKYFYRLRAVTASGDQGSFGWASSPVQLWPNPPSRPTITRLDVTGNLLRVSWNANPEPEVTGYRVYIATDALDAQDIRAMTLATEVTGSIAVVKIQQGLVYWVAVVAVADYTALTNNSPNPGKLISASSDPVSASPQTVAAPTPPTPTSVTVKVAGGQVQLAFPCDPNPTIKYMLLRGPAGSNASPNAVTTWQSPATGSDIFTLTDTSPINANVVYVIGCTNESCRVSYSVPIMPPRGQS